MCLIPIWKEQTNLKPSLRYIEPGKHLDTDVGQGGMCQPTKAGAKRAKLGCRRTLPGAPSHRLALVGSWLGLDFFYVGAQPNLLG